MYVVILKHNFINNKTEVFQGKHSYVDCWWKATICELP